MSFLSPAAIAIAAGLTIPPLVALYFLKLKRTVKLVPSTLLWKRAIEDLHVNSPFQRLRSSLLLLLQLLILLLAALALGKPLLQAAQTNEGTIIILIDRSASMGVVEDDGRTRLDEAKRQAKRVIDTMGSDARAMVIEFCDSANVVSSFDTNKEALKRKIDSIQQTQSRSMLGEAMSLAEAYAQNIIIGGDQAGSDIAPESSAPPATVFVFTDGRIEDSEKVTLQKFSVDRTTINRIGTRSDNVGIVAMNARRHYETPEILEVSATVGNFGPDPVSVDAVLYIEGRLVDVQTAQLGRYRETDDVNPPGTTGELSSQSVVVFDNIEFEGAGEIEVLLRVDDGLGADDRAWMMIAAPRHVRVLLVTPGNLFLSDVLGTLPLSFDTMSPKEYLAADEETLQEGVRSAYDVVIFDRHSTTKLPQGNYLFWGAIPTVPGVSAGAPIRDQVIFNWDETHPVLRHVGIESLFVNEWLHLTLPPQSISIIEGETSPVLAYLTHEGSQFLISAFALFTSDDPDSPWVQVNTNWMMSARFVVFIQNAIQFLSSNIGRGGRGTVAPGDPVALPAPPQVNEVTIHRPDKVEDRVTASGDQMIHYARTRTVGPYRVEPGLPGNDRFAVNLFNQVESLIAPAAVVVLGAESFNAGVETIEVAKPAWSYFLLAILVLLLLEWFVYNRRVFV